MRINYWPTIGLTAGLACGTGDGLDTKLSTELQQARIVVLAGPPGADTTKSKAGAKSDSECALRLRDDNTGTIYQLAQSTKRQPRGAPTGPAVLPEYGDYSVHPNGSGEGGSSRVRFDCSSLRPLGIVPARAGR